MKKCVLMLSLLLAVMLPVLGGEKAQAEETIKIGTIATTSGPFAAVVGNRDHLRRVRLERTCRQHLWRGESRADLLC